MLNKLLSKFGYVLVKREDLDWIHDEALICEEFISRKYKEQTDPENRQVAGCTYRAPHNIMDQCNFYGCSGIQHLPSE